MKKAFTLIELLVVVLIIGILSAIALPQYTKAVEKAKLAEALSNIKAIQTAQDIYLMENGSAPSGEIIFLDDNAFSIALSGGNFVDSSTDNSHGYITKNYKYYGQCFSNGCGVNVWRNDANLSYALVVDRNSNSSWSKDCWTQETDLGRGICKSLESQGYTYHDEDY